MNTLQSQNALHIERLFKLPNGFVESLSEESDWGYVIKVHALFESLFTQFLVEKIGVDEIRSEIYKLPMNGKPSKVSFLKSLDAFESVHSSNINGFIGALSQLRNLIVHHAEQLNFSFDDNFEGIENIDGLFFFPLKLFMDSYPDAIRDNGGKTPSKEILKKLSKQALGENPRYYFEMTVDLVLCLMSLYVENASINNENDFINKQIKELSVDIVGRITASNILDKDEQVE